MGATVKLLLAHVNHACQPNAADVYHETARVAVIVSLNEIQPKCQFFTMLLS